VGGEGSDRLVQAGDLDDSIGLAVSVLAAHVLAAAELLDDDLLGFELVHDLGDDPGAFDRRRPDGGAAVSPRDEEDLGENELISGLACAAIDLDAIALANPELVAPVFKNGVLRWLTPALDDGGVMTRRGRDRAADACPATSDCVVSWDSRSAFPTAREKSHIIRRGGRGARACAP
jgi:hypothetical protein